MRKRRRFKAIFFDAGGTILDSRRALQKTNEMLWQQVTQRFGIKIPFQDLVRLWQRKYHESWKLHEHETGRIRTIFDFGVWTESLSRLLQALVPNATNMKSAK